MGKITPIISHRASKCNDIDLPESNPWFVPDWTRKIKEQCRKETLEKYKNISHFLYWIGYQSGTSSSSGYQTFTGSFKIGGFLVNQQITYVYPMIHVPGTWEIYGFKYGISFIEWIQDKGIINAGSIDNLNEWSKEILTYNIMLRGSEEDKSLAYALLLNNIKGI